MVQQHHKGRGGQRQRPVAGVRYAMVALAQVQLDAGLLRGQRLQHAAHMGLGGGIVGDAQLPVRVDLGAHRIDHRGQHGRVGVVGGHQDRDADRLRQACNFGAQHRQHLAGQALLVVLPGIGGGDRYGRGIRVAQGQQLVLEHWGATGAPGAPEPAAVAAQLAGIGGQQVHAAGQLAQLVGQLAQGRESG